MSEFSSVLELALEVAAQANRIKQGEEAEQQAKRVVQRVGDVQKALAELETAVAASRRLHTVSGEQFVSLEKLDEGRSSFATSVTNAGGIPRNEVFTNAASRIGGVTARVAAELEVGWAQWTAREVAGVPRLRISLLEQEEQVVPRERWATLLKTAKVAIPGRDYINSFKSDLDYLHEVLDPLPDPPGAVLEILERLSQHRGLTLAELADEEIAVLREAGVADQIEVRRRGT
jgi:hypothetical protein